MAVPIIRFYEFAVSGVNPSGSRHLTNHASFVGELNTTTSGALDFGDNNIDTLVNSATKAVLFRVSDLQGNTKVQNMRFWAPSVPNPAGSLTFNMNIQNSWIQNVGLTTASGQVSTTLPSSQNLYGGLAQGFPENRTAVSGIDDDNVSQWIYLNITADTDVTPGRYGAGGKGSWLYRCTFDYI